MTRLLAAVGLALALASCTTTSCPPYGCGPATTVPEPALPTASPTASPKPTAVISAKGFITLTSPTVNAKLQSPVIITGDASVFEANVLWRISDTGGRVIAEGFTTASQGAPGRGTFTVTVPYTVSTETVAFVEVYSRSPKDGTIEDLVRVPVTLR